MLSKLGPEDLQRLQDMSKDEATLAQTAAAKKLLLLQTQLSTNLSVEILAEVTQRHRRLEDSFNLRLSEVTSRISQESQNGCSASDLFLLQDSLAEMRQEMTVANLKHSRRTGDLENTVKLHEEIISSWRDSVVQLPSVITRLAKVETDHAEVADVLG